MFRYYWSIYFIVIAFGPGLFVEGRDVPLRCRENPGSGVNCGNASEDSLLPHPSDCELFLYCAAGETEPICRQCPAALHFNPIKHVCDRPRDAGCSNSTNGNVTTRGTPSPTTRFTETTTSPPSNVTRTPRPETSTVPRSTSYKPVTTAGPTATPTSASTSGPPTRPTLTTRWVP